MVCHRPSKKGDCPIEYNVIKHPPSTRQEMVGRTEPRAVPSMYTYCHVADDHDLQAAHSFRVLGKKKMRKILKWRGKAAENASNLRPVHCM
jgi:hypothetical protein